MQDEPQYSMHLSDFYTKPWSKIGAYLVGIITGHVIHNFNNKIRVPKVPSASTRKISLSWFVEILHGRQVALPLVRSTVDWAVITASLLDVRQDKRQCETTVCGRDGTGQDFLDPTGKFQNHRRLTGRSTGRSTGFFTEGFSSLFNVFNERFSKGGGHG